MNTCLQKLMHMATVKGSTHLDTERLACISNTPLSLRTGYSLLWALGISASFSVGIGIDLRDDVEHRVSHLPSNINVIHTVKFKNTAQHIPVYYV